MTDLEETPRSLPEPSRHRIERLVDGQIIVHTEAHRLIGELEDAVKQMTAAESPEDIMDAYAVLGEARKRLYRWITKNTPTPEALYQLRLRF